MKKSTVMINNTPATFISFFEFGISSYSKDHTSAECDMCLASFGVHNLHQVPFLYKDMNDSTHEDLSYLVYENPKLWNEHYCQYYVCKDCFSKVDR